MEDRDRSGGTMSTCEYASNATSAGTTARLRPAQLEWVCRQTGNSLMHEAAASGEPWMLAQLSFLGIDLNGKNRYNETPLGYICSQGGVNRAEIADVLLRLGADPMPFDTSGSTPLHFAAKARDEVLLRVLLRYKADPNVQNKHGSTPLHYAVTLGDFSCVRLLLLKGANPNIKDVTGSTPLHLASEFGKGDLVFL
eukprot:gene15253-23294_t